MTPDILNMTADQITKYRKERRKAVLEAHRCERPSKQEKDQKIEEAFRRERNTRWATHTGNPDAESWYNNGGRMPEELELEVVKLKKQNYILAEIFELFDKREQAKREQDKREQDKREQAKKPAIIPETFEEWFDKTLTQGGRVKRAVLGQCADSLCILKKDLFQLLEKRCGKAVKKSGDVIFIGWSLKPQDLQKTT